MPTPLAFAAALGSEILNGDAPADGRKWSMAAMAGARLDALNLTLDPETGLEVARNLGGGVEVFGQGLIDTHKDVSAFAGIRWRF